MKFTDWFNGKVLPVRVGIYERKLLTIRRSFSYWNGKKWSCCFDTPKDAFTFKTVISNYQKLPWRGMAK